MFPDVPLLGKYPAFVLHISLSFPLSIKMIVLKACCPLQTELEDREQVLLVGGTQALCTSVESQQDLL